ncbi:DUF4974 domain-containing protein [Pedobacter hiemivivus]|uniref:DUF4974 domain-containing protein n=1 Tax=Pedobacter hiemivivus TaxID=2530454 RepID=A0A4U1GEK4_9SPHI|nr:FecR family protein [Pedobacter hiemivivus]TKC62358.1 DUF4974 domain-containing protein [Pedobacter hiemivivus]
MNDKEIKTLLEKYKTGALNADEKAFLESWYIRQINDSPYTISEEDLDKNLKQISTNLYLKKQHPLKKHLSKIAAAAAVILVASLTIYFLQKPDLRPTDTYSIVAGKNTATLTLASGKTITLSDAKSGLITNASTLIYDDGTALPDRTDLKAATNLTMRTPKGGTYQVVLPDGTRVWLNAASSLSFPSRFEGSSRTVMLNGEAYFEVTHNKSLPFHVKGSRQVVEVLGTHFNINSYADEPVVKTTLLEGSVRIVTTSHMNAKSEQMILKPGQQAAVSQGIKVTSVNTSAAVSWKNGEFIFRDERLSSIMRAISRWYNVEVVYRDDLSEKAVWGTINRYSNVSEVLDMISLTGAASFKIEGNKIIVMKQNNVNP